jgi:hypothetical protein
MSRTVTRFGLRDASSSGILGTPALWHGGMMFRNNCPKHCGKSRIASAPRGSLIQVGVPDDRTGGILGPVATHQRSVSVGF